MQMDNSMKTISPSEVRLTAQSARERRSSAQNDRTATAISQYGPYQQIERCLLSTDPTREPGDLDLAISSCEDLIGLQQRAPWTWKDIQSSPKPTTDGTTTDETHYVDI